MPLLMKNKKFKSPFDMKRNIKSILNNAPNKSVVSTTESSINMDTIMEQDKTTNSVKSKDNITDLPFGLNEPGVKNAYKEFLHKLSQSSGSKTSQICSPFAGELEVNSIAETSKDIKNKELKIKDVEKFDFMKNFKKAKKRSKKNYDLKSNSYGEDYNTVNKRENDNGKKQIKKDKKKRKIPQNENAKDTLAKTKYGQNEISIYEKMILLQESRNVGLYVLCDKCDKARYLLNVKDPLELPDKWYCHMNPDGKHNDCSDPEEILEDEDFLIKNLYNAGSIVWAKLDGWPWWPAMVEDDPDLEQYFWLEEHCEEPTYYHLTFFDSKDVTRAWLRPNAIVPFKVNMKNSQYNCSKTSKYYDRISIAKKQAEDAVEMQLIDRLKKYSFIQRYKPLKNRDLKKCRSISEKPKKRGYTKNENQEKSTITKKRLSKQNDKQFAKHQDKDDLNKKKRKKFNRICTISSLEDGSDISIILEAINSQSTEKFDLDFLDGF